MAPQNPVDMFVFPVDMFVFPVDMFVFPSLQNLRVLLLQTACILQWVSAAVLLTIIGACCPAFLGMLS